MVEADRDLAISDKRENMKQLKEVTDKNIKLCHHLMILTGQQIAGSILTPDSLHIVDGPTVADGARVLIIDDNLQAREATSQLLTLSHFAVTAVSTLADGYEILETVDPAFLIIDLAFNDGDPEDLIHRVQLEYKSCKVIVMTSLSEEQLYHIRKIPSITVVHKPCDYIRDLLPILRREK